jgi:hypothetical protein
MGLTMPALPGLLGAAGRRRLLTGPGLRRVLRRPALRQILAAQAVMRLLTAPAMALFLGPPPAAAHHVGLYTPRDNDVSTNFKQIKFALQAGKPGVALTLFQTGALRQEMRARTASLPAGLEESTRAALKAGDAREAELRLMTFFAGLARDLAREADRQLADSTADTAGRAATGRKFLEAIWRYYNLIDFVVSQRDNKAAVAVRLAFDEAETYVKSDSLRTAADPDRAREPLRRIAETLGRVIEQSATPTESATPTRRES